jgi:Fur family transcriptional regulator, zinc uptake regulator
MNQNHNHGPARGAAQNTGHSAGHGACRHAQQHYLNGAAAVRHAEAHCRDAGVRLTPIRRDVLEVLYSDHRPLGAYDLVEGLSKLKARRIAPISVYRTLDFLVEQGLVHRLSTRNAYVACGQGHGFEDTVAFLICETCGGVDERTSPAMKNALGTLTGSNGFKPRQQIVEILGQCDHCQLPEVMSGPENTQMESLSR